MEKNMFNAVMIHVNDGTHDISKSKTINVEEFSTFDVYAHLKDREIFFPTDNTLKIMREIVRDYQFEAGVPVLIFVNNKLVWESAFKGTTRLPRLFNCGKYIWRDTATIVRVQEKAKKYQTEKGWFIPWIGAPRYHGWTCLGSWPEFE